MALVDNRTHRVIMLCAMYFAQGVPWGFMVTALVAYLTGEKGISPAAAGELTAIVLVPWTFKLVWAPLIDTITIRSMGRRRPWIIGAELMMAVSLLGILMLGDLSENLRLLGWMFFIHNCFASLQDVATDALAIDVLPVAEQGRTNGMMWGSKLIGKAVGATVMAHMIYFWGLPAAVLAQFVLLVLIMLFPLLLLERPGEKRFPWSIRPVQPSCPDPDNGQPETPNSLRSPLEVLIDVRRAFSITTTSVFLVFGTLSTVGWGIVEVITKPLYTQELGWSFLQVSQVSGAAVLTEMTGALLGGFLADRIGRRKVMTIGFGLFGLLTACFAAFPEHWDKSWFAGGYLLFYPGVLAIGSVGFLSMGMRITWTKAAATIFTVYMTVSNIGHVIGNKLVGPLSDSYDFTYAQSFWFAAVALGLPLLLLPLVNPERVDQSKDV
jgi:PAT family beta-lactamase induction signal transducer AmpG